MIYVAIFNILLASSLSAGVIGSIPSAFSEQIDKTTKKEAETEEIDKDINSKKLHDIASTLAIRKKIQPCIFFLKQQQQIKKGF